MQVNTSRSDLVRNISIIEFLFIIVLLVLANFSYQVEQTNKKENKIILLVREIKEYTEKIKDLRKEIRDLKEENRLLNIALNRNDPDRVTIKKLNERLKELKDELSLRDERIASLERIEEKYQKLTGNDKPNCEIARKHDLTRILKITVKTGNLYDIKKKWPDSLDSEFDKVDGLTDILGENISKEKLQKSGRKVYDWTETQSCRFRVKKDTTLVREQPTIYTESLTDVIDEIFYQ